MFWKKLKQGGKGKKTKKIRQTFVKSIPQHQRDERRWACEQKRMGANGLKPTLLKARRRGKSRGAQGGNSTAVMGGNTAKTYRKSLPKKTNIQGAKSRD